jgi:MOSC domain-containing protein
MDLGTIAGLWRYPVKSLKAEPLTRVRILADGLEGDRTAALIVETPTHARAGKPYRGKESAQLHLTSDPETAASYAADAKVMVTLDRGQPRWFDAGPVSVLFDLWVRDVEALVGEALDPLRWRPNVYVRAAPEFSRREPALVGATLRAGTTVLRVVGTIGRCVTPTYDVGTGEPLPLVLEAVATQRDNVVGVYCEVVTPGEVALGDGVRGD